VTDSFNYDLFVAAFTNDVAWALDISYARIAVQSVKAINSRQVLVAFRLLDNCGATSTMVIVRAPELSLVNGNSRFSTMGMEFSPISEDESLDEADDNFNAQLASPDSDLFRGVVTSGIETGSLTSLPSASESSGAAYSLTYIVAAGVFCLAILGGVIFCWARQKREAKMTVTNCQTIAANL
jgi:hypothetical protein